MSGATGFPDALLKAAELTSPGVYLLTLVEDYSGVLNWRGPSLYVQLRKREEPLWKPGR